MAKYAKEFWKQVAETEERSAKILAERRRQEQAAEQARKGGK